MQSFFRFIAALFFALATATVAAKPKQPNIVIIMADDMGFSDIGCYGSEIKTPVLDKLAANGLRFTQFYNTSRCCPTRASLLTGMYQHQAGIGLMTGDNKLPGYRGELGRDSGARHLVWWPAWVSSFYKKSRPFRGL